MNRVFVDMDGVLADFDGYIKSLNLPDGTRHKEIDGLYANLPEIEGAVAAVRSVIGMGFDVWIATKPPTGIARAYSDKAQWIFDHIPELTRKVIITPDKGLLGDKWDFLIDDRIHKANCSNFSGLLWDFSGPFASWNQVKAWLSILKEERKGGHGWPRIVVNG